MRVGKHTPPLVRSISAVRYGATIIFADGIEDHLAQQTLERLRNAGLIEDAQLEQFDPEMGKPVWYIP